MTSLEYVSMVCTPLAEEVSPSLFSPQSPSVPVIASWHWWCLRCWLGWATEHGSNIYYVAAAVHLHEIPLPAPPETTKAVPVNWDWKCLLHLRFIVKLKIDDVKLKISTIFRIVFTWLPSETSTTSCYFNAHNEWRRYRTSVVIQHSHKPEHRICLSTEHTQASLRCKKDDKWPNYKLYPFPYLPNTAPPPAPSMTVRPWVV